MYIISAPKYRKKRLPYKWKPTTGFWQGGPVCPMCEACEAWYKSDERHPSANLTVTLSLTHVLVTPHNVFGWFLVFSRSRGEREDEEGAARNRESYPVLTQQLHREYFGRPRADRNARLLKENLNRDHQQGKTQTKTVLDKRKKRKPFWAIEKTKPFRARRKTKTVLSNWKNELV